MELNRIYQMDCIEGMKKLDAASVDLVLTDPPYNITDNEWDTFEEVDFILFTEQWMNEAYRLSKGGFMLMFWSQQKMYLLDKLNTKWKRRRTIIWNMPNAPIHNQHGLIFTWQPCIVYEKETKDKPVINNGNGHLSADVIVCNFAAEERFGHPTIKPSKLITGLLKKYSNEGGVVLDPFMGSGTTAVCAKKHGRSFIGFEKDDEYYAICTKRLNSAIRQMTLIDTEVSHDGRTDGDGETEGAAEGESPGDRDGDGLEQELCGICPE